MDKLKQEITKMEEDTKSRWVDLRLDRDSVLSRIGKMPGGNGRYDVPSGRQQLELYEIDICLARYEGEMRGYRAVLQAIDRIQPTTRPTKPWQR